MHDQKFSFTSASTFPIKLFMDDELLACIKKGRLFPVHIQINPTNKCNQSCAFCSCARRDKDKEIPLEKAVSLVGEFKRLGARAVTITGGGEPTLYKGLDKLIDFISGIGLKAGLVSNGLELDSINGRLKKLTWCRISFSDQQKAGRRILERVLYLKEKYPRVDWGLSYVVTKHFDKGNLRRLINFAQKNRISHIRVVSDLLDLNKVPKIGSWLAGFDDPCGRIIYQGRRDYAPGRNPCYLSLLKPNIGPDGRVYPCCGVQYALSRTSLDFPLSMSMGRDIKDIYAKQRFFDGRKCKRCYYDQYNSIVAMLMGDLKHREFI